MARLHHESMEELAGLLAGLSDIAGSFEFEQIEDGENYGTRVRIPTHNFVVTLYVKTHPDAIEEE
jgi:hypothetical protein